MPGRGRGGRRSRGRWPSRERRGDARGPAVLERLDESGGDGSTDASMSFFPMNGSPIWTDGRFSAEPSSSSWLASTDAPPMPSRPVVRRRGQRAGRKRSPRAHEPFDGEQPNAHRVHEAVVAVGLVEDRLAADGRHADAVPVGRCRQRHARSASRARETQAVEKCHGPHPSRRCRAGCSHACRRSLERLDGGRVVASTKQTASLSPRSSTPAFSPDLEHARAVDGSLSRSGMLVAAVPDQRSEKTASSKSFGSRSRERTARTLRR